MALVAVLLIVNFFVQVFLRKLKRAEAKGNLGAAERLKANKPRYSLDHIVKERFALFLLSMEVEQV